MREENRADTTVPGLYLGIDCVCDGFSGAGVGRPEGRLAVLLVPRFRKKKKDEKGEIFYLSLFFFCEAGGAGSSSSRGGPRGAF